MPKNLTVVKKTEFYYDVFKEVKDLVFEDAVESLKSRNYIKNEWEHSQTIISVSFTAWRGVNDVSSY